MIQAGTDYEDLCVKVDGRCTGESSLPWQRAEGEYTTDCPAALVKTYGVFHRLWRNTKLFGLPMGPGWMKQPARWMRAIELQEIESGRMGQRKPQSDAFDTAMGR